jgi:uncharacterized membrane protein YfcA
MTRRRSILGVVGGLTTIGVLLALPAPHRTAASSTSVHAGSPTLSSVWPAAKPFTIPAGYPDGST